MEYEPHYCDSCGKCISGANVWLCNPCVSIAVELGFEATPSHYPGDGCMKAIREKRKEIRLAETAQRSDGQAQPEDTP